MSEINDILHSIPLDDLAAQLGVDRGEAEQASTEVIQHLLSGMANNVADPDGELSLAQALAGHQAQGELLDGGPLSLDDIDIDDGEKIVQHVFGQPADQAASFLGGGNSSLFRKLLPILAPLVLAYLSRRSTRQAGPSGGSLLDSILGGGSQAQAQQVSAEYDRGFQDGYRRAQQDFQNQQGRYQQAPQQNYQQEQAPSMGGLGDLLGSILGGGGLFGGR